MLNNKLNAHRGFTPAAVAPPIRYPPNRYYVIVTKRRSGMRGQALSPPSSCQHFIFYFIAKGILQSQ